MPDTSPWVYVTLADVQASMLAEALSLAQQRAAQRNQADPFTVIMPRVVARVRNKAASALRNQISADPLKVPPELLDATALLIAHGIALPVSTANATLLSDDIRAAVKQAERDLDAAASGKLAISLPDDPCESSPVSSPGPIQTVGGNPRQATRESLRGL